MKNNSGPESIQPRVEKIQVFCTRPQHDGDSTYPHMNLLMPEAILGTPEDCKCGVCGMPLILNDRFVPIRKLGSGGFGITFLARDLRFQRQGVSLKESIERAKQRAIKLFHPHRPLPAEIVARAIGYFRNEGRVLDDLKNERIPKFIDSFDIKVEPDRRFKNNRGTARSSSNRYLYLVQEYIDGRNLNSELKVRPTESKRFTEPEVKDLLKQLLPVLKEIHSYKILHRDISPQNIILCKGKYHLIDFGAVKQRVEDEVTLMSPSSEETVIGNPEYMAPEQARSLSNHQLTPAADIYALGTTCVHLLTNLRPSTDLRIPSNLTTWKNHAQVSPKFADILNKMLAPRPEDRYRSAEEVLQVLDAPESPEPHRDGRGAMGLLGLLAAGAALLAVGLGGWFWWWSRQTTAVGDASAPLVTAADFSRGENILREILSSDPTCQSAIADKRNGFQAFADAIALQDQTGATYRASLRVAEESLKSAVAKMAASPDSNCRYDPETLIALGNVRALQIGNPVTLAVVVPLSGKGLRGSATEILAGVAIEQATYNGIEIKNRNVVFRDPPSRPLQIVIAQDADDPDKAKQIATALVKNEIPGDPNFQGNILGVVGHSSSLTTDPAGIIYGDPALGDRRLPLIAPTSTAVRRSAANPDSQLPTFSDYVFRMSPTDAFAARDLASYADSKNYRRAYLIFDSKDPYSRSLRAAFSKEFAALGGLLDDKAQCDLSEFTGNECLQKIPQNIDFIMIMTSSRKLTDTSQVIRDNARGRKLPILGGDTLYSGRLVGDAGEALSGTIVSVPWYAQLASQPYKNLFKMFLRTEAVSWRVGTAHDSAMVLVEAIQKQPQPTRSGTFARLKTIATTGVTGPIKFCASGDRQVSTRGLGVIAEVQSKVEPPYRLIAEPQRDPGQGCAE